MEVKKIEVELHISGIDAENLLFESNTKAYHNRFVNWAKETVDRSYLFDLIDKMLSAQAGEMLINNVDTQFYKGQANSLLRLKEIITRKASVKGSAVSDKEN